MSDGYHGIETGYVPTYILRGLTRLHLELAPAG
jgi:hypothetical protein